MEFYVRNTQSDGEFGAAKEVCITSFKTVTIFSDEVTTKIVHMHSDNDFTIEKVSSESHDLDDTTQVVSGPRAGEIICQMLEIEKAKGATFIWNGARFKNRDPKTIDDPLCSDFVESEDRRRKERRKGDRRSQTVEK